MRLNTVACDAAFEFSATSGVNFSSTTSRTGTCMRILNLVSGTSQRARLQFASNPANGPYFFRFYFNLGTAPSAENRVWYISNTTTQDTGVIAYITVGSDSKLRLYDEDGQVGAESSALALDTYYRVEIQFNRAPTAGGHVLKALIDGTSFASSSARDFSIGANHMYVGGNLHLEAQTTGAWRFDDIAINDGLGSYEFTYPGDEAVYNLFPSGAGDANTNWTNDYTAVDENPPTGTDFQASNTLNAVFDHALADTPAGIGAGDTIKLIAANYNFSGAAATDNATFVPRLKLAASGTVKEGNGITPVSTSFRINSVLGNLWIPPITLYDKPGAGGTFFLKSDVDTAQIGARISASSINNAQISTVWLTVAASTIARPAPPPASVFMSVMD